MKVQHLFTINIFFALFFGISGSFFPETLISYYGIGINDAAIWTTRLSCGSILGFSTLMWFGRKASPEVQKAICVALCVQDVVGAFASIELQAMGNVNTWGWSNIIIYILFAIGYIYFAFIKRIPRIAKAEST